MMSELREELQPMFYSVNEIAVLLGMEYEMARRQMQEYAKMGITEKFGRQTKVYRKSFHELYKPARVKDSPKPREGWNVVKGGKR